MFQKYLHPHRFTLEKGGQLKNLEIGYCTYGQLNAAKDNVVWVCHALTANADVADWWPGLVGVGCIINPEEHFIVCANILGSCYGTTGPLSTQTGTGNVYYASFPKITIRDMVQTHIFLSEYLGIEKINLLIGGSMGGYQALEWSLMQPDKIKQLFLLATSAKESAWGIAIHTAQRLAIEADATFGNAASYAGEKGLKAARAIGMLTYRSYELMEEQQSEDDINKTEDFKAASYIHYQGEKLTQRFNAYSYYRLTQAMDSHNIARDRTHSVEDALRQVQARAFIIGIVKDMLCPITEQQFLHRYIPGSTLVEIDSPYGHDGFLTETEQISMALRGWWSKP